MRQRRTKSATRGTEKQQRAKVLRLPARAKPSAPEAGAMLAADRGPRAIDEATYTEYAAKLRAQFRVDVDGPELTYLASRWAAGRFEHVSALRRIAPEFAALLGRQRVERERFLQRRVPGMPRTYPEVAELMKKQYPGGHDPLKAVVPSPPRPAFLVAELGPGDRMVSDAIEFDVRREQHEAEAASLIAWLRAVRPERATRKTADTMLITTARGVADWTRQHGKGGRADWQATVMIMGCHGWDLPGRSLSEKAKRLEDRVTNDQRRRARATDRPK